MEIMKASDNINNQFFFKTQNVDTLIELVSTLEAKVLARQKTLDRFKTILKNFWHYSINDNSSKVQFSSEGVKHESIFSRNSNCA